MLDQVRGNLGLGHPRRNRIHTYAPLRKAAWAFTTRRVREPLSGLVDEATRPVAGDLVLARVDAIRHHSGLQLPDGRRKTLFTGDEIVVVFGNRYAPNQFEAVVPETQGPCHLVAAGGVAGKALSWHASISRGPTEITPLGILARPSGRAANLRDYALPMIDRVPDPHPPVFAVVGTAMDSGKTQTAAYLVRGLTQAGKRVGYAKVTGTGAGGDTWLLHDAGARRVLDFTDAGLASTYLASHEEVERVFVTLVAHLTRTKVNAIVLEIADGVLQVETAKLLESKAVRSIVGGILFASCDAMGAVAGSTWLRDRGLPLLGLSGVITASPLQRLESVGATGLSAFSRQELGSAKTARELLARVRGRHPRSRRNGNGTRAKVQSLPAAPNYILEGASTGGVAFTAHEVAG